MTTRTADQNSVRSHQLFTVLPESLALVLTAAVFEQRILPFFIFVFKMFFALFLKVSQSIVCKIMQVLSYKMWCLELSAARVHRFVGGHRLLGGLVGKEVGFPPLKALVSTELLCIS